MKSYENLVASRSDYYVYLPSLTAQNMFFYPLYCGHFIYMPGYSLYRKTYDSFLLLYVQSGCLILDFEDHHETVNAGQFMLIDCYQPHAYSSAGETETIWCHFDGLTARSYYDSITSRLGNVFSMANPYPIITKMNQIYDIFHDAKTIREPLLSKYINDILTAFLLYSPTNIKESDHTGDIEEILAYINEHLTEELSLESLAERAGLSVYHFIRIFKKETSFTPHEYIVNIRISTAKYLLKNSNLSVKEICFNTGFSSESVFCNAFRKHTLQTPNQYRNSSG